MLWKVLRAQVDWGWKAALTGLGAVLEKGEEGFIS